MIKTNDESILRQDSAAVGSQPSNEFAIECITAVCIHGDSLPKYRNLIEKRYGADFYQKCDDFVLEVRMAEDRKKLTKTSALKLESLARELGVSAETLADVKNKIKSSMEEENEKGENHPVKTGGSNFNWILPLVIVGVLSVIRGIVEFNNNTDNPTQEYFQEEANEITDEDSSPSLSGTSYNIDGDEDYESLLSKRELTESDLKGKSNYELQKNS